MNRSLPEAPNAAPRPTSNRTKAFGPAYRLDEPGADALLTVALEAHMRLRRYCQVIDMDGESVVDRFRQTKVHPLLQAERDARSAFISGMKALNLDLGE